MNVFIAEYSPDDSLTINPQNPRPILDVFCNSFVLPLKNHFKCLQYSCGVLFFSAQPQQYVKPIISKIRSYLATYLAQNVHKNGNMKIFLSITLERQNFKYVCPRLFLAEIITIGCCAKENNVTLKNKNVNVHLFAMISMQKKERHFSPSDV